MKSPALNTPAVAVAALLAFGGCTTALGQSGDRVAIVVSSGGAADISTLDPHRATLLVDKGIVAEMFNGLVRFAPGSADP